MKMTSAAFAVSFFFLMIILSVSSCRGDSDMLNVTFSKVEKCMDAFPDSALKLLKTISNPENLRGESQARYALLTTQAMDKNYTKFSSDSLISVALSYYMVNQREPAMYAKAQFYYGRVMREMNRQEEALKYFLAAKKHYDGTHEYKMLALIAEEIGMVNRMLKLDKDALKRFQESLILYQKAEDSLCIVRAYQNIGRIYLLKSKWDSCNYCYYKALDIAQQKSYKAVASILHELGVFFRQKGDLLKAESYFLRALEKETDRNKLYLKYLSLGYLYLQMDNINAAREYIEKSTLCPMLETQRDAYNCLYWLEKDQKEYLTALEYCEKADSISVLLEKQNSQIVIVDLQKKYENEKLQKENLQMKMKYTNIIWIGTIAFWAVAFFMCYYYYKNKNNKKRIIEIGQQISNNKQEILQYQTELKEIQELKDQVLVETKVKTGELNGKIMLLTAQNKTLTEQLKKRGGEINVEMVSEPYIPAFRILLAIKDATLGSKLSNEDWEKIFELFDFLYMDYASRLKRYCSSLTKHDLEICCLLKFGFTNEELSKVFLTTLDSVTKAKGRLKGRLCISPQDNLDTFLRKF